MPVRFAERGTERKHGSRIAASADAAYHSPMSEMIREERDRRRFAETWKRAGPLLEEMRWQEARARSESEKWEWANELQLASRDHWPTPQALPRVCGLIEQQRLFRKLTRG